jgi:hypothetical protein
LRLLTLSRILAALIACGLLFDAPVLGADKPHYGGTLRVAEELLERLGSPALLRMNGDRLEGVFPIPFTLDDTVLTLDLSGLEPEARGEIERAAMSVADPSSPCHWILQYPRYSDDRPSSITLEGDLLTFRVTEPGTVAQIASSSCLIPERVHALLPFVRTQFGYEANDACLAGRPFLDSIVAAEVDPANPFLSFKLKDVDVFPVPEERFAQVSTDPDVVTAPATRTLLYLRTSGMDRDTARHVAAAIDAAEVSRAVLNGHAEILLARPATAPLGSPKTSAMSFVFPDAEPYRLVGQRLRIQLQRAGFTISPDSTSPGTPAIELASTRVDQNIDLTRYQILRKSLKYGDSRSWQETWEQLLESGSIIPLLIHTSWIAYRKDIQELKSDAAGVPDFADCWLLGP